MVFITGHAQESQNVVYLTDGSIIRGYIIERVPDDYLKIEMKNGKVRTIYMEDVEKISRESVKQSDTRQTERRSTASNRDSYSQNRNSSRSQNNYDDNEREDYYDDEGDLYKSWLKFGLKSGLNVTNLSIKYGSLSIEPDYRYGIHIGAFAEFKREKFAVQPELLFSMQGAVMEESEGDWKSTSTTALNYINLPVMAKYYVIDGLSLEAGPQLGFLLTAKTIYKVTYDGETETEETDMKDDCKAIDFAFNLGASYQLPNKPFGFSARYSLGLTNIGNDMGDDSSLKNHSWQLGVFVKF
jgi:hypothetical protein